MDHQLRPLGVGEILDAAFKLYRRHFWTLVGIVVVVTTPVQVLSTLVIASSSENAFDPTNTEAGIDDVETFIAGIAVTSIASVLVFILTTAACFRAVGAGFLGHSVDWKDSLRFALRRLGPLLWVSFLVFLAYTLATAVAVAPAFASPWLLIATIPALFVVATWLGIGWSMLYAVLMTEDVRGVGALRRSMQLVRGRWWPTFGVLVLGYILVAVIQAIITIPVTAAAFINPDNETVNATLQTIAGIISSALATPLLAAIVTLVYFDLRVRKEGFDLQLLAERMGTPAPAWETAVAAGVLAQPQWHGGQQQWPAQQPAAQPWPAAEQQWPAAEQPAWQPAHPAEPAHGGFLPPQPPGPPPPAAPGKRLWSGEPPRE